MLHLLMNRKTAWLLTAAVGITIGEVIGPIVLASLLIIVAFVGCVVFIFQYRPFSLRAHGRAGQNLLIMSWSLAILLGLTILMWVVPLPMWFVERASAVIIGGIAYAVWQRAALLRWVRKQNDQPSPGDLDARGRGSLEEDVV